MHRPETKGEVMKAYRLGGHHKVTIIEYDETQPADKNGQRPSDKLIATAQTEESAQLINRALGHWRKFEEA